MVEIVLFHSILGLRPGVSDAADRLRSAGHVVHTPDFYGGRTFHDYGTAGRWLHSIGGIPELVRRTQEAVVDLPHGLVYAGFSNGGGSAELLAATRPGARGAVLLHAALPLEMLGVSRWPGTVPVQVHYAKCDPFRDQAAIDGFTTSVQAAGAELEFFEYPVTGHLITDPGLPDEYDQDSAELLFERVLAFLDRAGNP